jgi:putative ABC transport system substrate-binding protein
VRRVGLLGIANDTEAQSWITALVQRLQALGWTDGRNLRIDYRYGVASNTDSMSVLAKELIALQPDVIVGVSLTATNPLRQHTRSIPVVFVQVPDPVKLGFVASLAHPGGNITGFTNFEYSIGTKWIEALKEIAPGASRMAVILDPGLPSGAQYLRAIETAASSLRVQLTHADVRDAAEIEQAEEVFVRESIGGLIVLPSPVTLVHRNLIIANAARRRWPAMYPYRYFVMDGGLISYTIDLPDLYRRAASYVDRILRGENPANLPVQQPTKFALIINLKTASALGLEVPPTLLARADEVIE